MLLSEAKEILKKNGYTLINEIYGYNTKFIVAQLKNTLAEQGIVSKILHNELMFDNYEIHVALTECPEVSIEIYEDQELRAKKYFDCAKIEDMANWIVSQIESGTEV